VQPEPELDRVQERFDAQTKELEEARNLRSSESRNRPASAPGRVFRTRYRVPSLSMEMGMCF
jgi:hypothetical protein